MKRSRVAPSFAVDMRENEYDAIVVGARCAGSPTAMLLARKGYKVLVVDRATFPSDTISTHLVHPPGVAALKEWGLLDRLLATGCPGIDTYAFDFGTVTISGAPGPTRPRSPTPRGAPCSTSCWWTRRRRREPRCARDSPSTDLVIEDGRVTGIRGHGKGEPAVPSARVWSWARTATTRSSLASPEPSRTTRCRRSRSATTRT